MALRAQARARGARFAACTSRTGTGFSRELYAQASVVFLLLSSPNQQEQGTGSKELASNTAQAVRTELSARASEEEPDLL
ncbi:hypothetical protein GcM3_037003 [Golovinomyces cichoracearum]|uniref:Uncharacterized protein n=1 Tax=Golovinomyces cichoracearum TaxID=62708 RepID=A0A420J3C4_9PEZI|nr:hypothetical protein GcM3_037003 [Golovinomyces cichoracearum]